jgi:hypothetical protein
VTSYLAELSDRDSGDAAADADDDDFLSRDAATRQRAQGDVTRLNRDVAHFIRRREAEARRQRARELERMVRQEQQGGPDDGAAVNVTTTVSSGHRRHHHRHHAWHASSDDEDRTSSASSSKQQAEESTSLLERSEAQALYKPHQAHGVVWLVSMCMAVVGVSLSVVSMVWMCARAWQHAHSSNEGGADERHAPECRGDDALDDSSNEGEGLSDDTLDHYQSRSIRSPFGCARPPGAAVLPAHLAHTQHHQHHHQHQQYQQQMQRQGQSA